MFNRSEKDLVLAEFLVHVIHRVAEIRSIEGWVEKTWSDFYGLSHFMKSDSDRGRTGKVSTLPELQ